jgi:hypothetical protein
MERRLTDDQTGIWMVITETSRYYLDLGARRLMRVPGQPHFTEEGDLVLLAHLERDHEWVPLVEVVDCEVGWPLVVLTEPRGDGSVVYRQSTLVQAIHAKPPTTAQGDTAPPAATGKDGDDPPTEDGPLFYDRAGRPIDLPTHLRYAADPDYRFLARTRVAVLRW